MTPLMWAFEYHSLQKKESEYVDIAIKVLKHILIGILGLNAIKPEDENGRTKKWEQLSEAEKEQFIPLVHWVGRTEMIRPIIEKAKEAKILEDVENDKAYEDIVNKIDKTGGDMEPILGKLPKPIPPTQRPDYLAKVDKMVTKYDTIDDVDKGKK